MTQKVILEMSPEYLKDIIVSGIKEELNKLIIKSLVTDGNDEFLTKNQTCEILKCCSTTLWNWEKKKILIPVRKGRLVRYKKEEVLNFKNC